MDELYNMLSSSARIDKSKRRKTQRQLREERQATQPSAPIPAIHPHVHHIQRSKNESNSDSDSESDDSTDSESNEVKNGDDSGGARKKRKTKRHSEAKIRQIHQEEVAAFRNKLKIYLSNSNRHDVSIPDPITNFSDIVCPSWWGARGGGGDGDGSDEDSVFRALRTTIVRNIEGGRWINPTPVSVV